MAYDIHSALERLENNLKNLDSAKKQVEKTVKSSEELQNVVSGYVTTLNSLLDEVQSWKIEIGKYQNAKISDVDKSISRLKTTCDDVASGFDKDIQKVSTSFSKNTKELLSSYSNENTKLEKHVSQLSSLQNSIKQAVKEINILETILNNISNELRKSQSYQDKQLTEISNKVTLLPTNLDDAVRDITKKLDEIRQNILAQLDDISIEESRIKNQISGSARMVSDSINDMKKEVVKNIKINRWILIAGIVVVTILGVLGRIF